MMYQDILTNKNLHEDIFQGNTPRIIEIQPNKDRWSLIAVGYENETVVTYLIALIQGQTAELCYFSNAEHVGINLVITERHAHISRLSKNAAAYASALNVNTFFVTATRNHHWMKSMKSRLEGWDIYSEDDEELRMFLTIGE